MIVYAVRDKATGKYLSNSTKSALGKRRRNWGNTPALWHRRLTDIKQLDIDDEAVEIVTFELVERTE